MTLILLHGFAGFLRAGISRGRRAAGNSRFYWISVGSLAASALPLIELPPSIAPLALFSAARYIAPTSTFVCVASIAIALRPRTRSQISRAALNRVFSLGDRSSASNVSATSPICGSKRRRKSEILPIGRPEGLPEWPRLAPAPGVAALEGGVWRRAWPPAAQGPRARRGEASRARDSRRVAATGMTAGQFPDVVLCNRRSHAQAGRSGVLDIRRVDPRSIRPSQVPALPGH